MSPTEDNNYFGKEWHFVGLDKSISNLSIRMIFSFDRIGVILIN